MSNPLSTDLFSNFASILNHANIPNDADKLVNNTWNIYSTYIQLSCIVTLIHALLAFLSWALIGLVAIKLGNKFGKQEKFTIVSNLLIMLGYSTMIYGAKAHLIVFFDIWNWIGLFKPNMFMIHQVITTVDTHNNIANLEKLLKLK